MIIHYLARTLAGQLYTFVYGPYPDIFEAAAILAATDKAVRLALIDRLDRDGWPGNDVEGVWQITGDGTALDSRALALPLIEQTPRPIPICAMEL